MNLKLRAPSIRCS